MRKPLFLLTLLFTVFFLNTTLAQELRVITLDKTVDQFDVPVKIVLLPGDTLQFKSVNGDFSINIKDAYKFLKVREDNLKIRVNSAGDDASDLYEVRSVDTDMEVTFFIYCVSDDSWPDAPPKIIIVSQ